MAYIHQPVRAELYEAIKKHAKVIHGRVLDIGSGTHSRYQHLFNVAEYVRLDTEERDTVDVVGSIEQLPLPSDSFDSIVCTQVLGDVPELPRAFSEMYRVLKKGGVALITESLFDPLHDEPHDFWRFTPYGLSQLATNAGFSVETSLSVGGYHTMMQQMRLRRGIILHHFYNSALARFISAYMQIATALARFQDARDPQAVRRLFAHSTLILVRKS